MQPSPSLSDVEAPSRLSTAASGIAELFRRTRAFPRIVSVRFDETDADGARKSVRLGIRPEMLWATTRIVAGPFGVQRGRGGVSTGFATVSSSLRRSMIRQSAVGPVVHMGEDRDGHTFDRRSACGPDDLLGTSLEDHHGIAIALFEFHGRSEPEREELLVRLDEVQGQQAIFELRRGEDRNLGGTVERLKSFNIGLELLVFGRR